MITNDPDQGNLPKNIKERGLPPGQVHYFDPDFQLERPKVKKYSTKKGFEFHFDFISGLE